MPVLLIGLWSIQKCPNLRWQAFGVTDADSVLLTNSMEVACTTNPSGCAKPLAAAAVAIPACEAEHSWPAETMLQHAFGLLIRAENNHLTWHVT